MAVFWFNDDISKPRPVPVVTEIPMRYVILDRLTSPAELMKLEQRYGSEQMYPMPPLMRLPC